MKKTRPIYFALVLFGLTIVTQMFHGYNYAYYVEEQSLISMTQASIAKIIFIIFDGLNDVLFGYLSEKSNFKYGKRKSWIFMAMPFLGVALVMTYIIDGNSPLSNAQFFLYYIFITVMFDNISSIMYVNYNSLYPVLYSEQNERAKASSLMHLLEIAGIGVWALATPFLKAWIGYIGTSIVISVIFIIIVTISLINIHEPKKTQKQKSFSFKKLLKEILKNKKFMYFNLSAASFLTILSTFITLMPFITKYVFHVNDTQMVILFAVIFVALLISIRVWSMIIRKKGHRRAYKLAFTLYPFAILLITLSYNFISSIIFCTLGLSLLGGVLITPDLMMASLIDKDNEKHAEHREAAIFSISSFSKRITLLAIVSIIMFIASMFGYVNGKNPGPNPDLAFRVITTICLPFVAFLGAIFARLFIKATSDDS